MAIKHIQIIYRTGQQRQQIANVKDNIGDYNGLRDTIPPFYIRTWDESVAQTVLDLIDGTLKSAFVTKQECLDKYFCLEVLTVDQFSAPSTWRFVAVDAQIYRDEKIQKNTDYYNANTALHSDYPTLQDFLNLLNLEDVWTLNTV